MYIIHPTCHKEAKLITKSWHIWHISSPKPLLSSGWKSGCCPGRNWCLLSCP